MMVEGMRVITHISKLIVTFAVHNHLAYRLSFRMVAGAETAAVFFCIKTCEPIAERLLFLPQPKIKVIRITP